MKKIFFGSSLPFLLSGCMYFADQPPLYSTKAIPDLVWITQVTELPLEHENDDPEDSQTVKPKKYEYTIKDQYQRQFIITEVANQADYKVGECAIRWWDRWDKTYPRLNKTDHKCTLLSTEMVTDKIPIDQQSTAKLKRIALLNSWLDTHESAFIRSWGEPDRIEQIGDDRYLEYIYKRTTSGSTKRISTSKTWICKTRWQIKNNYVFSYTETGNACY
ncbi:MAG: hypothetical protein J6562_02650 [Candidatus Schmidhempelia sp.]|nr:hypothetical protein [Candidatus Schmidhempelia sp.]